MQSWDEIARGCRVRVFLIFVFFAASSPISADDGLSADGLLAMAKYAGFCGAIIGMHGFQQSTKMPGGDEFFSRFVNTEAARQGLSVQQMMTQCEASIAGYDKLMAAADER